MADEIRIGTVLPFSGPPAVKVNAPHVLGAMIASVNDFNAQGGVNGRTVKLLVGDNAYDVDKSMAALRTLVEDDKVSAIVNANGTPQVDAALPMLLDQYQIPVLHPLGAMDSWYNPPRRGLFGLSVLFNDMTRALGRWVVADGYRRIVILYPDFPAISPEMAGHAKQSILDAAPSAAAHLFQVTFGTCDGAAMADRIEQLNADAVIILVNWPELTALARELQRRRRTVQLYSWSANVTQEIIGLAGDALEGMRGVAGTIVSPLASSAAAEQYRAALAQSGLGHVPEFISLFTFGQMKVFLEALRRAADPTNHASLYEALYSFKDFATGILPPVTYAPDRHLGITQMQPMRLTSGRWEAEGELLDLTRARAGI